MNHLTSIPAEAVLCQPFSGQFRYASSSRAGVLSATAADAFRPASTPLADAHTDFVRESLRWIVD